MIGDVVRARAMKMKKNYGFARLMEVLVPSADSRGSSLPAGRPLRADQLQAMSYEAQLRFKERKITNNWCASADSRKRSFPCSPIIGMKNPWRYRNKAQFPFGRDKDGNIIAGFYAGRTHRIVPCEDCLLGVEENQRILKIIKDFMNQYRISPYDEESHTGLVRHALIRKGFRTGQLMVCLIINVRIFPGEMRLCACSCRWKE